MKVTIGIAIALLLGSTIVSGTENLRGSGGGITPLHSIIWVANRTSSSTSYE